MDRRSFLKAFVSVPAGVAVGLPLVGYAEPADATQTPDKPLADQIADYALALVINTTAGDYAFPLPLDRFEHTSLREMTFLDRIEFVVEQTLFVTGSALVSDGNALAHDVLIFDSKNWCKGQTVHIWHIAFTY